MSKEQVFPKLRALTADISIGGFDAIVEAICDLGKARTSSYVCCVNAHMAVESHWDAGFAAVVNGADIATADGMPILRALQRFHGATQERVAGNDLLPALLAACAQRGIGVYLYGGRQQTLDRIVERAAKEYPHIRIAGTSSPPFRPLTEEEEQAEVDRIEASGAGLVMVSLGCPKQERWMAAMKGRVQAPMIGLGGAFLLYAGEDSRAPEWMRKRSLEWLYRLCLEPRRLWKRYLVTNTVFITLWVRELLRSIGRGRRVSMNKAGSSTNDEARRLE